MSAQGDLAQAVDALRRRAFTQATLDLLDKIINQDGTSRLVAELIASERAFAKTEEDAVSDTMDNLEALAGTSQENACMLMASLWPVAAALFDMHEVCDAIDLWIWGCPSERLTRHLKLLASSEADTRIRRHFESLVRETEAQ